MVLDLLEMPLDVSLREAIAQSGLSANQLGKELGVAQSTISRFMQGADIRLSVVMKLADRFGLVLAPEDRVIAPEKPAKRRRD